jgi:hypothetical protein
MPRPVCFTEFPDDLLADVQRRIAGPYHGGDFTQDPWFLGSWHEQFDAWGMPLSARVRAMQGLTRVYTPEVCRQLLIKPNYAGIVSPLFSAHWPGMVMTALQIGLDLAEIAPARDDQLSARLCEPREYFGAVVQRQGEVPLALFGPSAWRRIWTARAPSSARGTLCHPAAATRRRPTTD